MASVWKRLQRVNKRAAKFQYTASYHQIDLETTPKWRPSKLSVVWTRRSRRVVAEPLEWEPSLKDPLKGNVIYPLPENHTIAVTLFKDSRSNELEDKDWMFVLEDVTKSGKRRKLAQSPINMRIYASLCPSQRQLTITLQPTTQKIVAAQLKLTLSAVLLAEGPANDEDMQSLASLLSVNNSDIAVLEDLDDEDYTLSDHSSLQVLDLRQQMEEMTHSLTNSDLATPNSVQSLCLDNSRTPTAAMTPGTPMSQEPMVRTPCNGEPSPLSDYKLPTITDIKAEPKYTSTPQKQPECETTKFESRPNPLKNITFRTKSVTKINLKPLELKTNLNSMQLDNKCERDGRSELERDEKTPVNEERCDIEKTPAQDLLEWCQQSLSEYPSCEVSDLSSSWRSGLAFAALIHRYRPHFIDFSGLDPSDAEGNLRTAFAASARLGISQLITVNDVLRKNPDRLAIMTYLFQMRSHFEGKELQVEQLGNCVSESSYLVGRHDTDSRLPAELFSREVVTRRSQRGTLTKKDSTDSARVSPAPARAHSPAARAHTPAHTPAARAHTPDLLAHTNNVVPNVLSPNHKAAEKTTKWFTDPLNIGNEVPPKPERLMTRRELNDPFASDEEVDKIGNTQERKSSTPDIEPKSPLTPLQDRLSSPVELPKPTAQLLSRHDELRERARQLLEATKKEAREKMRKQNSKERDEDMNGDCNGELGSKKPMSDEERQNVLRERARKLIADARAGIVSPQSPSRPRPQLEIISQKSVMEEYANGGVTQIDSLLARADSRTSSPRKSLSPDRSDSSKSEDAKSVKSLDRLSSWNKSSPLRSFNALVERLTPDSDSGEQYPTMGSYIQHEQKALEREQLAIDAMAHALEPQLRSAMDTQEEDRLMSQWFNLVNKKNALLRRQMQLNIIEQEEDLSRRCELLARELRLSLAVEEWRKGSEQKLRERLLLQELLEAVNERDRLVQEMDEQEKAIADDDEIERNLSQVELQRRNNCILQ